MPAATMELKYKPCKQNALIIIMTSVTHCKKNRRAQCSLSFLPATRPPRLAKAGRPAELVRLRKWSLSGESIRSNDCYVKMTYLCFEGGVESLTGLRKVPH